MIPANSLLVKCPHCGGKKELLQLISGNTCGSELWSDVKQVSPMLPKISPVQKCPECGHTQANIGTNGKAVCGSCASILKPLSGDEAMSLDIRRIIHEWQLNGVPA